MAGSRTRRALNRTSTPTTASTAIPVERNSRDVLNAHGPWRREPHGQRVRLDRRCRQCAGRHRPARSCGSLRRASSGEMLARAFPHQRRRASTARRRHRPPASGSSRTTAWRDASGTAHPEATVAVGAMHVGRDRVPVVAQLVDEAEPQPDRIGKIELGHRARQRAIGEKRRRPKTRRRDPGTRCPASSLPRRDDSAPPADIARSNSSRRCADTTAAGSDALQHAVRTRRAGIHCALRRCAAATADHWPATATTTIAAAAQALARRVTSPVKMIDRHDEQQRDTRQLGSAAGRSPRRRKRERRALRHPAPAALAAAAGGAPSRGNIIKVLMRRPSLSDSTLA